MSQPVLLETQKNIQAKVGAEALERFYKLLMVIPLILASVPPPSELKELEKIVTAKDTHVLAASRAIQASFLMTLDREFVLQASSKRGF